MVGLEIKREMLVGQLATWGQRALPWISVSHCSQAHFPRIWRSTVNTPGV
jgi:hypothetical protein